MRLIDADAAAKELDDIFSVCSGNAALPAVVIKAMIRNMLTLERVMPTIDAVSVVRCKDCEHCRMLGDGTIFTCSVWDMEFYDYNPATYYCAEGRRRDET